MSREITAGAGTIGSKFPPSVQLKEKGNYIKGRVVATRVLPADSYGHINTALSLELIDLEGSTSVSVAKGEYQEVDVAAGDIVDFVGRGTVLRAKIPLVKVGETITITNDGLGKARKGAQAPKLFKVVVDEEAK